MNRSRRTVLAQIAGTLAASALGSRAWAQGDSIKVILGFPPGGLPDLVARSVAEQLQQVLGVTAVVENNPGANGRRAAQAVRRAAADGRTLLIAPASNIVFLPHVYKDLGYDPLTDFVPVAQFVESDFAFAVNSKLPVESLAQWGAWCRAHPQEAVYGSPGTGSVMHFLGHALSKALNAPMKHIPYKGNSFALNDVGGGHVSSLWATTPFLIPFHQKGQVRVLGTTGPARSAKLPQTPTFRELGFKDLDLVEGIWLLAPAATPAAQLDKLERASLESVKSPAMTNIVTSLDAMMAPLGRAELAKVMKQEYERRKSAVAQSGFSLDS